LYPQLAYNLDFTNDDFTDLRIIVGTVFMLTMSVGNTLNYNKRRVEGPTIFISHTAQLSNT